MSPLPHHRPQLLLGPLESEILELIWHYGTAVTVKTIHDHILKNPDRELAYASVTTVFQRLQRKGWLQCDRHQRPYQWSPRISREEAQILRAHQKLHQFLAISNPDRVAAFADSLDAASVEQLDAIAQRLNDLRRQRSHPSPPED
jgi:predicted transcriptional regulator